MKHNKYSQQKPQEPGVGAQSAAIAESRQNGVDFSPSADEVARRAYFCYVNEGSRPGHDVQHWLEAEAQLLAERDRTRIHGFHNRT
jgi:hypothetical protein